MRKGGGKAKGASFERKVCEDLSRFVEPDGEDTLYWRSAMSGGRGTVQAKKGIKNKTQLGDITCVHSKGEWLTNLFVIECKFYAKLEIESSLLNKKGKLYKFWKQIRKIARKNDRHPILIAKQNRTPILMIFDKKGHHAWETFKGSAGMPFIRASKINMTICLYEEVLQCRG